MNYDPKRDLYRLLRVSAQATVKEIKDAHRALIREAHPDKSNGSTELAAAINNARDVLCEPAKRAAYDAKRQQHLASKEKTRAPRPAARTSTKRRSTRAKAGARKAAAPKSPPPAATTAEFDPANFVSIAAKNATASWRRGHEGWAFIWGALGALVAVSTSASPRRAA